MENYVDKCKCSPWGPSLHHRSNVESLWNVAKTLGCTWIWLDEHQHCALGECGLEYFDDPMVTLTSNNYAIFWNYGFPSRAWRQMGKHFGCGFYMQHFWQHKYNNSQKTLPSMVLVNIDRIARHCLMITTDKVVPHSSCYQEIWHQEHWADVFSESWAY